MKVIIQRSLSSSVSVSNKVIGILNTHGIADIKLVINRVNMNKNT